MLSPKKVVRQTSKKALSLLLAILMIMTSMSVCFGTISFAAATGVSADQWDALADALNNDTVKNATFSGTQYNYKVDDPDGSVIDAVEAYWTVFKGLADKSPSGSSAGNRTINQINTTIRTEISSRLGGDVKVDTFLSKLVCGASVTATGTQQSTSETTSSTGKAPGADWSVPGTITVTVTMAGAVTGYTLDNLPDSVVTSKSFSVTHKNDKYDYTYTTRDVTSGSGCNKKTTTYYTHKYTYYSYISATSSVNGDSVDTQTIKDSAATLEQYKDYFSMSMDDLVAVNAATLDTVSNAVKTAKSNVEKDFGITVFNHFFSAYKVDTLVQDIKYAKEIQVLGPKLLKAYEGMEKGYADIITDKAALTTLAGTMKTALDAYDAATSTAQIYVNGEGFVRADVAAFRNAILREIELIELRELIEKIVPVLIAINTYNEDGIDEGTLTTAMIAEALARITAYQSDLSKYQVADIDMIAETKDFKGIVTNAKNKLDDLASVAGYNDRFSAEYAKFASEIFSVTDANGDIDTLLSALKNYDSWYTGLKNLIAEMKSVLGEDIAEKLFDDLNDVMTARMDDAYVALNALLEAQIDYAYDLFKAYTSTYGEKVNMASVSEYRAMKASIGLINTDAYSFLNGTPNFNLSAEAVRKYTEMQKDFPQYQQFLDSHGFSTYQQSFVDDLVRPAMDGDVARDGAYKTTDAEIEKIIGVLDSLLQNDQVKKLLGDLINKDENGKPTGKAFDLGALIENLLNESVYTDSLVNTIVQFLYPVVGKAFAEVWAGIDPHISTTFSFGVNLSVEADLALYDVDRAIEAAGIAIAPKTLANKLKSVNEYKGYDKVIEVLSSITTVSNYNKNGTPDDKSDDIFTNPWEDAKLFKTVIDEKTGEPVIDEKTGEPKKVYKLDWGIDSAAPDKKREAFVNAVCAALSGLEPLLYALLLNQKFQSPNTADSSGGVRGGKIGTNGTNSTVGYKKITVDLKLDPITLWLEISACDGWDNVLAPLFEALGLTDIPHSEDMKTTRDFLEKGLLAMIDQLIEKVSNTPVTFILEVLPNICYALEGDLVEPILKLLAIEIYYEADAHYQADITIPLVLPNGIENNLQGAMKAEKDGVRDPAKINVGEMINLKDLGLDISSFQAIWNMIAGGVELLAGLEAPNAGYIATLGKLVEKDTNRSAKTYNYGTAGKAYHIEANKADVLVYLLKYVLGSGLIDGLVENPEGFVADLLTNLNENTDAVLAAVVELFNQKEYDTLRKFEWFNGLINNESVVGNSANEIYLNPGNDWTEEKAEYLYNNLDAIVAAVLTMANVDFDKETEDVQNDLGELLGGLIGGLLSDKTLTSLAALLAKLDLNALLAPKAEEDAPATAAEGEAEASTLDVNALVKEFLGLDLAAVAAKYADIAAAVEADPEYVADFGIDAGNVTFAKALADMLAPLSAVLDFILAGENLEITVEDKTVELIGYDGYNNAIIPLLEALGCDVTANPENALEAILTALVGKIESITKSETPIKAIIDLLPGVFYFITSKGLSVSVRNLLQGVYVILDTIRPVYDLDLNELINGLLPEGLSINIDDIGLEFVFDLLKTFVPNLDLSGLKDVIYDICYEVATDYDSASTLQTEWKKGDYSEDFDQADLLTVVLSFVLEWATIEDNAKALDEMLGTDGLIASIGKVFEDVDIAYGTPDWMYWFETEEEFNSYVEGNTTLPNTLEALTYPNDWSEESAKYIADNLASLVDMVIGLIDINGQKYKSVADLLNDLVYGDFNLTVGEGDSAITINYLFSDETINALLGLLKGILANVDDALLGAGYILDVDVVGLKNYTCEKDITTISAFCEELAYVLDTYAKGLVDLLFFGDDFRIAKKSDNTDTIVINGGLGYEKGLALVLEALGCDVPAADEATVKNVLAALATRVEEILASPVNKVVDLLPNLVYFLNANGASVAVNNLLAPVYAIIEKINALGVLEAPIVLKDLLGFDLKYLSLADILALVKDKTGLDLSAAEEILVDLCFGKIEKAKYTYKMVADREDVITVLLTTALMLVADEDFAAKLDELLGKEIVSAIKTVFESAPVEYKTPEWYALDESDIDYDNETIGVIKYAIEYPNNWTEESAKYVADNLVAIGDMVAGIIDSNYDSLGALLGDKVDIYTPALLETIQKTLGDLIGGLDENLKDLVNVGLGAADSLLGADVQGLLNYDVSKVNDKKSFVAALTGMLMEVEGLVDWLLLGEDYKFFVYSDKSDIITLNGGHGYANGLALVLEALGVENLPDVYAMEEIDTEAVVSAVLTATFDRVDAILANPVKEVFDILPNVLYFINANGLGVAVENLLGAVNALLIKLEGFGLKVDIASLVNFSEILGVETKLTLYNIQMADVVALVAKLTGLNLDKVADVLVGFALGRVAAYESVSSADITAKMYYHDDFAKYDMITVLATVAIITLTDDANATKVKEMLGEEIYQLILNLCNMGEVEVQEFDWQLTEKADTGEVFSAFESSFEYAGDVYGDIYTEEQAQYIADNFGEFVNNIVYLLGLDLDGNGEVETDLTGVINGLINGGVYNSKNVIAIRDALAGILAKISGLAVNGKVVGGYIVDVLKTADVADIKAVAKVDVPAFENDRAQFVASLCDVLEPLYNILKYVLADEDFAFFVNAEKTDAITLKGAEGYAYGILPLLETLECEGILAPADYYAAVEADGDVLLTSILNPLLDRVDEIVAAPADEILAMLPNLIYFINSNGVDTVVKNTLNAVYAVLAAIEPVAKIDLYELIGIDLAEIDFEWLVDKLLEILANAGYSFTVKDIDAIAELTVGTLESYTSLNGKTAYKMVYAPDGGIEGGKAEMVTVIERLLITFITDAKNQEAVMQLLKDKLGMTEETAKYVEGLIKLLADCVKDTSVGMQSALATIYYVFYGVDIGVGEALGGINGVNNAWKEALDELGKKNPAALEFIEYILGWDVFEDLLDPEVVAPNGLIRFFQSIANIFAKIGEFFKKLFSFGK